MNTNFYIEEIINAQTIANKVKELALAIKKDVLDPDNVVFVGLLKGSFILMADLLREINLSNAVIEFMVVSSYGKNTNTTGNVKIIKDLDQDIANKHIIIIEDIIDTGLTLQKIVNMLQDRKAKSVKICTLLNKPSKRIVDVKVDYVGFDIEDYFVVGYGIDYAEQYRNLPYIAKVIFNN
ncbi:hypoxanthine phosphoribosyltransferase [Rickettsiales bacterium LUAb2]